MAMDWQHVVGMQVLSHIAERLKDLHKAGYVHRDIKPANIMWLPRTKRWTLLDFGCAAQTYTHARTGFSLFYAAPEVLRAYLGGAGGLEATEALDAWSLGVLAIELLTGKPVFDHMRPKEEVPIRSALFHSDCVYACMEVMRDGGGHRVCVGVCMQTIEMILGDRLAPWEDPETARELLRPLGIFKTGVLRLIDRDPAQRSSIPMFQQACLRSLANTSITAT